MFGAGFKPPMWTQSGKALFLFYGKNTLAAATDTMAHIYEAHADEDGFLYAQYSGENTFGGLEELEL